MPKPEIHGNKTYWTVRNKEKKWGVVDNNNTVLVPLKYLSVENYSSDDMRYVAGYISYEDDDADLYDPKTWKLVGKKKPAK